MRAMLIRRAMLIGRATGIRVLGDRRWPASGHLPFDPTGDDLLRLGSAPVG
jgi:hypothetical protein